MDEAVKYSNDHRNVTVQITKDPDVFVRMDVQQVTMLMRRLTILRQQLQPAVSTKFTQQDSYLGTASPAWAIEKQSNGPGILLHIREPGIGWLHFYLQPDEAHKLGELLISSVGDAPKPRVN